MASKGRKKTSKSPPQSQLTDDDALALTEFCKDVMIEDIALPAWEGFHSCLDLTVPLTISPEEALNGVQKNVCFARTIMTHAKDPGQRKPASCLITLPANLKGGESYILQGEGDRLGDTCGNLKVIIRIKPLS